MNDDINIYQMFYDVYKKRKIFIVVFLVIFSIFTIRLLLTKKVYTATSSFFFPLNKGVQGMGIISAIGGDNISNLFGGSSANLSDYVTAILESRMVTDEMINKYRKQVFKKLKSNVSMVALRKAWKDVVKVNQTSDNIIEVNVTTTNPELSAKIANDYIKSYQYFAENSVLTFAKRKRLYIEKQRDIVKKELSKLENKLLIFQNKKKVIDIPEETKVLLKYLADMQGMSTTSEAIYLEANAKVKALKFRLTQQAEKANQNLQYPMLTSDPAVQSMYSEMVSTEVALARLRKKYTDNHPSVKQKKNQLEALKQALKKKIGTHLSSLRSNMTADLIDAETTAMAAKARVNAFNKVLLEIRGRMKDIPELGLEYGRLFRDVQVKSKVLAYMEMELEKARLEEAQESTEVQILDKAIPPDYKSGPKYLISGFFIILISVICGLLAVFIPNFIREQKRRFLLTKKEEEQKQ